MQLVEGELSIPSKTVVSVVLSTLDFPRNTGHMIPAANIIDVPEASLYPPGESLEEKKKFFEPRTQKKTVTSQQPLTTQAPVVASPQDSNIDRSLQDILAQMHSNLEAYPWVKQCNAPTSIALIVEHILSEFEHKRKKTGPTPLTLKSVEANQKYHHYFPPQQCAFTIPPVPCNQNPDPNYHSIQGSTIYYIDWSMSHPNVDLYCPKCKSRSLQHTRTNFKKNRNLFPIWNIDGTIEWCCVMKYECCLISI